MRRTGSLTVARLLVVALAAIIAVAVPSAVVLSGNAERPVAAARPLLSLRSDGPRQGELAPAPNAGSVSGLVYFDKNGNYLHDAGEPGLPGVMVTAIDVPTAGETYSASTITAADGTYAFSALGPGSYRITEADPSGYVSTTANTLDVNVGSSPATGKNFGDAISLTVTGAVFEDADSDGVQRPSEPGLSSRLVEIVDDIDGNGVADEGEPVLGSDVTDTQGVYLIAGVKPGLRVVRIYPEIGGTGNPRQKALPVRSDEVFGSGVRVDFPSVGAEGNAPVSAAAGSDGQVAPHVRDQIMARFLPETSPDHIGEILRVNRLTVRRHIQGIGVYVLGTVAGGASTAVAALERLPEVEYAELDYIVQGELTPNDPNFQDPINVYAPRIINAPSGWDIEVGQPSVVVAVLDSGVSLSHSEINGQMLSCPTICDFVNNDLNPADDHGHGTHVAGIIAAKMNNGLGSTGIAPGVKVMPVKVLSASNAGTWSGIAAGIDYAVAQGADVINLSLGGTTTSITLQTAIQNAAAQGVFIVAAAGNNGSTTPFFPAYYDETMAVVNTDNYDQRHSSSNYGSWVDIAAPGFAVYSTYWSTTSAETYTYMTGTSQAAPHVSALAALLLSHRPDLKPADLRALIQHNAKDLGAVGRDDQFGWGRVDVAASLAASTSWTLITPTPTITRTPSPTPTATHTHTPTPSRTPTASRTPSITPSPIVSNTPSQTPTNTATATATHTATATPTATRTATFTPTIPPPYVQRVNVGSVSYTDTRGQVWAADKAFTAGSWGYSTRGSAKSYTLAVNNTDDDFLYQKLREIAGEYRFTVANGMYDVTLKFAEFAYFDDVSRKMTISMESVARDTFTVFTQAGKYTALEKTYTVTVTDGLLNILFAKGPGAGRTPMISAIEVKTAGPTPTPTPTNTPCWTCPTATWTPTATPTFTPSPYEQRVNCGSTSYTDTQGQVWAADKIFATGSWGYTIGTAKTTSNPVAGTLDDFLYQKYREKPGEYRFTVPNGTYLITLKFAEFTVTNTDRLMTISIEGIPVDTFSVWNLVGKDTALDRTYEATVTDGLLNIGFARASGAGKDPDISAIEVRTK